MSPLSLLSSENEQIQEEVSYNKTDNVYRSSSNNNSGDNTVTSGNSSERCTNTVDSFHTPTNTTPSAIPDETNKQQIGFYFVIFFNSASPLLHSKNISKGKCEANNASHIFTTQMENTKTDNNRKINSKAQELFTLFSKGSKYIGVCEKDDTLEYVNYFHTVFSAKDEVSHATLQSIALPNAFGGSTNELELVLTSLSPSSSPNTSEKITDVEYSYSYVISSHTTQLHVNVNEQQLFNRSVPCDCQVNEVHDDSGRLRFKHIILTSTFNTVRVMDLTQMESKRVAVCLVLTCPPSRSVECAFLLSHVALLKSCLHKLIYFAMRSIYRYFSVLSLFSCLNVVERQEKITKLCEKLAQCQDATEMHSMIKHDLNNILHIRFPLPFIGLGSNNSEHVFLPLLWGSNNEPKLELKQQQSSESSLSLLSESTIRTYIRRITNIKAKKNIKHSVNAAIKEQEKLRAPLPRSVGKAMTLSSALFEALSCVLEFDASFTSAFVISLLSSRYNNNNINYSAKTNDSDISNYENNAQENLNHEEEVRRKRLEEMKKSCVKENNYNNEDDDVYQGYWQTINENDADTKATTLAETVNTKIDTLRGDKLENVQVIVECSNDVKLALSLLIIAVFFWGPELSDIAQPSYCAETIRCTSSELSEEEEYEEERWAQRAFINAIAGLVPQNNNFDNNVVSTKDNVVINVPIQWVCDLQSDESHLEISKSSNWENNCESDLSELEQIIKYVNPYCTFDKLFLINVHKHTCQEILVERNIRTTVTVNMNVKPTDNNTNHNNSSKAHCCIVQNPFHCTVKNHKYVNANSVVTNLLHEALLMHKRTDGVVLVTQTLPRMMYG